MRFSDFPQYPSGEILILKIPGRFSQAHREDYKKKQPRKLFIFKTRTRQDFCNGFFNYFQHSNEVKANFSSSGRRLKSFSISICAIEISILRMFDYLYGNLPFERENAFLAIFPRPTNRSAFVKYRNELSHIVFCRKIIFIFCFIMFLTPPSYNTEGNIFQITLISINDTDIIMEMM